jgi:hypothetical protein
VSSSPVSSHSRQIQSPSRSSDALREAGTIVTPQVGQIGGRSSSTPKVWTVSEAILYAHGPNADALWGVMKPIIESGAPDLGS